MGELRERTIVPLTLFFGVLTLTPLVMALALVGLGLARRATLGPALTLTMVGAIIPILGLAYLLPEVSGGFPLEISLLGDTRSWLALYGRVDALSIYAALGAAVIVAPMLLWLAWRAAPLDETEEAEVAAGASATVDETPEPARPAHALGRWQWTGVALALALETLALWVCFAENIVLLGIVWIAMIAATWALGELGSEQSILDLRGLSLMLIGPVVWLVTVLLIAGPAGARLLLDLTGTAKLPIGHLFVISIALVFAAGAYPALAWVRKRASIATPAGLGAVSLAVMPAALFVGARTFSIGATLSSSWPALNIGKPSITIGIVLTVLGALSAAIAGMLALGRRDPRSLIAALTLLAAGWGLVGLGIGAPVSELGVTLLLATSVLGLGAAIASLVAAGAITADIEPDSAGPRILGEPLRPALMFAWLVGVASLVGVPLLAGFTPLQLISADSLNGTRLNIPLVGLAWIGSALMAIALTRATAPAFSAPIGADYLDEDDELGEDEAEEEGEGATEEPRSEAANRTPTDVTATADEGDEAAADEGDEEAEEAPITSSPELRLEELPGVALATLIIIAGVAPALALTLARDAAGATLQAGMLNALLQPSSSGYVAGVGQWFATPPAILAVVVALALAYLRTRLPRSIRPLYLGGAEGETAATTEVAAEADAEAAETAEPAELVALPEPTEAWSDLLPALRSNWATPGVVWLGLNDEDESASEEAAEVEADDEADDDTDNGEQTTAEDVASLRSVGAPSSEPEAEATGDEK